jgi:hypothetical protein
MVTGSDRPASVSFGRFEVSPHRREFLVDGRPVQIGGRAFDVLMALIDAPGSVVSKNALMEREWAGSHRRGGALPRHQTVHATLEWSHDLLTASERVLLHRLAVRPARWRRVLSWQHAKSSTTRRTARARCSSRRRKGLSPCRRQCGHLHGSFIVKQARVPASVPARFASCRPAGVR